MSTKTVFSCALILAMLEVCAARAGAQPNPAPAPYPDPGPAAELAPSPTPVVGAATPAPGAQAPSGATVAAGISPWILYHGPCCCGPVGGNGPIQMELQLRSGPTVAMDGDGPIDSRLGMGWTVQGAGRSLFLDPSLTRAWVIEFALGHTEQNGKGNQELLQLNAGDEGEVAATVRTLHRTQVTFDVGGEYYLVGSAYSPDWRLRVGWDGGLRWGTTRLDFNAQNTSGFIRQNSWNWGPMAALHTDLECCKGCCTYFLGFRAEWDVDYCRHFGNGTSGYISDINLLLNLGVRY